MRLFISVLLASVLLCKGFGQSDFSRDSTAIVSQCQQILLNPEKSDSIHTGLVKLLLANPSDKLQDVYYYNYAKVLFQIGQPDSAYQVSELGLDLFQSDSLAYKASKHHNIKAAIYSFRNQYPEAIAEYTKAVQILDHHQDTIKAALVKSNIGNTFFSLNDYQSAYNNCKEAMEILAANHDTIHLPGITAVVALSAVKLEKFEEGNRLTKRSMELSEKYKNPIGLIVSYLSEGENQMYYGNYKASKTAYLKSLAYAEMYRQAHYILLDKIGLLKAELNLKNYTAALDYGIEALAEGEKLANNDTKYASLKYTGRAYAGLNNYKTAYEFIDSAHQLYISTASIENKTTINELLIQYESEKKERQLIASQLETASQKILVNKRNNWIAGLTGLLFLAAIFYWFYRKRQVQKMVIFKQEADKEALIASMEGEENERERLANELHDGIASALTGVRLKIEQNEAFSSNQEIIAHLREIHDDTRRISHNLMPLSLHNTSFEEALTKHARENTTEQTTIKVYKLHTTPFNLEPSIKKTLYRICQELTQNVLKHANSSTCSIQLNQTNEQITISVEDEGRGFEPEIINNSQGINSIKNRLKKINGTIHIESRLHEGTLVVITINK